MKHINKKTGKVVDAVQFTMDKEQLAKVQDFLGYSDLKIVFDKEVGLRLMWSDGAIAFETHWFIHDHYLTVINNEQFERDYEPYTHVSEHTKLLKKMYEEYYSYLIETYPYTRAKHLHVSKVCIFLYKDENFSWRDISELISSKQLKHLNTNAPDQQYDFVIKLFREFENEVSK